jgi:hypothetical protein
MNPLALMAYLDAQNKARQRQAEQSNAFEQQMNQQRLAYAQMGAELKDKAIARKQNEEQFALTKAQSELQKQLTEAQLAEALRNSKLGPIKDKQAFLQPLLQPHAAYTAATEAYRTYMDPSNKVKLPSKQRVLLDAVRTARSNLIASRNALSTFGKASGYTDVNYDDLMKEYGVEPLPMWGVGNQTPNPNPNPDKVGLVPSNASAVEPTAALPVANGLPANMPTLGLPPSAFNAPAQVSIANTGAGSYPAPPPPPTIPSALFGPLAVGFPMPALGAVKPPPKPGVPTSVKGAVSAKPVAPSIPAKPMPVIPGYNDTYTALQKIIDKYKQAEGISYADLDEPQQKSVEDTAEVMFKEVMDSFVPQTWDAKNSGREAYAKDAADFLAHGASEKMITRLLGKYAAGGDLAIMKNILLQRFANKFNEYSLPPALTEKLVKGAKDALDVVDKRSEIEGQRITQAAAIQEKESKAAKLPLELRALNAQVEGAESENKYNKDTRQTRIAMLKQQLTNAQKDALESDERYKKLVRENKEGSKPVKYMDVWKSAGDMWERQVTKPIDRALTALEDQTKEELKGLATAEGKPRRTALRSRLEKFARVRTQMTAGIPQELITKFNTNDPSAWTDLNKYKDNLISDLRADPELAPFFTSVSGASSSGGPVPGN